MHTQAAQVHKHHQEVHQSHTHHTRSNPPSSISDVTRGRVAAPPIQTHLLLTQAVLVKLNQRLKEVGVGHHGLGARPAHVLQATQDDHTLAHLRACHTLSAVSIQNAAPTQRGTTCRAALDDQDLARVQARPEHRAAQQQITNKLLTCHAGPCHAAMKAQVLRSVSGVHTCMAPAQARLLSAPCAQAGTLCAAHHMHVCMLHQELLRRACGRACGMGAMRGLAASTVRGPRAPLPCRP